MYVCKYQPKDKINIIIYVYIYIYMFDSRLITQAYLLLLDKGGGNLERDLSSARAFEMYG